MRLNHTIRLLLLLACNFFFFSCADTGSSNSTSGTSKANTNASKTRAASDTTAIPAKVYTVLAYVLEHDAPPAGYVGGRKFGNYEGVLPAIDSSGKHILYQEWDVNKHRKGVNRGSERLITGNNKKAYYTANHYLSFTELKDAKKHTSR